MDDAQLAQFGPDARPLRPRQRQQLPAIQNQQISH
jgi:hypothetical protein